MLETVLKLENIYLINNGNSILENVNVDIRKNTCTAIIGKSGSGKSSMIKLMAGLLPPSKGTVSLFGKDYHNSHESDQLILRKRTAFSFQNSALLSNLNIRENLMLPLNFHFPIMPASEKNDRVMEYLKNFDMVKSIEMRPAQLSTGEQKLISIARAMITRPELLFLDDPLVSLDASIAKEVIHAIGTYSDLEWTTVVIVTASKNVILGICNYAVLIEDKGVKICDTIDNIKIMPPESRSRIVNDIFSIR